MKNLWKLWLGVLAITLIFSGCPETDSDSKEEKKEIIKYDPLEGLDVKYTFEFEESTGWDEPGHGDWERWHYDDYKEDEYFDLSSMLTNKKVYILTYLFSSNIDIDELGVYFCNIGGDPDWEWKMISNYVKVNIKTPNIKGGILYTGSIVLIPQSNAAGCNPEFTFLRFIAHNRNVSTAAVLYFYGFTLTKMDKEENGLEEWTGFNNDFKIDAENTYAKIESNYQDKSNVLHIKPIYNLDQYGDFLIKYDLNNYRGKTIEISMSMYVWLTKDSWIAWQINSSDPFYPVVCGAAAPDDRLNKTDVNKLTAGEWHTITGSYEYTVPNTDPSNDKGKQLYLSGQQIKDAQVYFANPTFTITEK